MRSTVSVPPGIAYGADEAVPDNPVGMTVDDAIYHTVHGYPGGVAALAARMGVPASTLTHKANQHNTSHYMRPSELVSMQHLSGNAAVLHAIAGALGYTVSRATPDQAGGDPVQATMRMQCEQADFLRAVADPLARTSAAHSEHVTPNEMRRADYHAQELIAAINHTLATLRAHMRRAPEVPS
jgi:hypothetical protein